MCAHVAPSFSSQFLASCGGISPTSSTPAPDTAPPPVVYPRSPIKHIIVLMLQNRSFDNLFGTFPGANGIAPGVPGYSQVDGNGQTITPTLLTDLTTADVNHTRTTYVAAWDNGKMDKYAATNGDLSMGHYDGSTPGVSLLWNWARQYSLADNYFASVMGSAPADESGGWWDHVPPPQVDGQGLGARVPLLVISPFAKTGYISHTQLDHVSILRFIQWNWGLQPLNDRNGQSTDLRDMLVF